MALPASYSLDSSRPSYEDDEEVGSDYIFEQPQHTFFGRLLRALQMRVRQRKQNGYFSRSRDEAGEGLLKQHGSRDQRRRRRSTAVAALKRLLLVLPILALLVFGVIHLVEAVLGRAALFWDDDGGEVYMPSWGLPGHIGAGLSEYPTDATRDVIPIPCHSHNDYWRRVPLFDAIHWGCTGVEADVWLFDDELFVGHSTAALTRNRTFHSLYVNPLVELLDAMNPGSRFANATTAARAHGVFDEQPEQALVLLVDLKTDGPTTFPALQAQLAPLRDRGYLTHWNGRELVPGAVTVVGTGNTPFDQLVADADYRDIFFDAPLDRMWELPADGAASDNDGSNVAALALAADHGAARAHASSGQGKVGTWLAGSADAFDASNSYYASVSFTSTVGLLWRGRLSARQLEIVRGQIRGAQRRGLRVRYWDTPAWPVALRNHVWTVLMREGADVLNVDDLRAAATLHWNHRVHGFW